MDVADLVLADDLSRLIQLIKRLLRESPLHVLLGGTASEAQTHCESR